MISMRNVYAIFLKQIKDTLRNMEVLVLFIVYPIIALVMSMALSEQGGDIYFVAIFGTMHFVFTPIVATAAIIAEEKEKNTLRMLILSNVTPIEYFISVGGFILLCSLITGSSFIIMGVYSSLEALKLIVYMIIAGTLSIILGMAIGSHAKNMMSSNGIAIPVAMVFAFVPMLANFQPNIKKVAEFMYGQQLSNLFANPNAVTVKGTCVVLANFVIFLATFMYLYRKNKLD